LKKKSGFFPKDERSAENMDNYRKPRRRWIASKIEMFLFVIKENNLENMKTIKEEYFSSKKECTHLN